MAGVNKNYLAVSFLVVLAIVFRIFYLYQYSSSPMFSHIVGPDVGEYDKWARSILHGNYIWKKTSIHSPLYPYYLAFLMFITGGNYFFIRFFQLLIGIIPFLFLFDLIYKSGKRNETKFIAYVFLILSLFYLPLFYYQAEIISETLLIPLLCFTVFFLSKSESSTGSYKKKFILISGILLGLAVITHPISIFFVFGEFVYLSISCLQKNKRKKNNVLKVFILFIMPIVLIVFVISLYNTYLDGKIVFIQRNSGYNLFLGNNAKSNGMCYISAGPEWNEVHMFAKAAAEKAGISKDAFFYGQVYDYIKDKPIEWLKLICKKALLVWNHKDLYSSLDPLLVKYYTNMMYIAGGWYGILSVFALFGFFLIVRRPRHALQRYRHFIILVLSIWVGLAFTVVSDRYRYLMLPGMFLLFSYALNSIYKCKKKHDFSLNIFILFGLAVIVVYFPIYKIDLLKDTAFADSMYGEGYCKTGEYIKAEKHLIKALKIFPEWDRCYTNLGIINMKNNPQQAVKYFKQASIYMPANPSILLNTALSYKLLHNRGDAEKYFQAAFAVGKTEPEIIYNYSYFLFEVKKYDEALYVLSYAEKNDCMNNKIRNLFGVIYLTENKPVKAEGYFEKAVLNSSGNINYKLNLALAYIGNKKFLAAENILNAVLNDAPNNKKAIRLKERLKTLCGEK
jgi:Flp pilus assembly protein TadD/4-amino-4-deoxy-L-arabinose transferase-like glycosyltransferase